jgi:glycosyltransferase involved in cell wall biosynthesis
MIAVVYGTRAGTGGLGLQAATAITGLATSSSVVGIGPGRVDGWPFRCSSTAIRWVEPPLQPSWVDRQIVCRFRPGMFTYRYNRGLGEWAAGQLEALRPTMVYTFTQVGLESLEWAVRRGVPSVLDNPNGHIRGFSEVCVAEWTRWIGGTYRGHPTDKMIRRVEREYELANRIRVSSQWAKQSLMDRRIPDNKAFVCPQPIDLERFHPPEWRMSSSGPLRIVYVGSLDVRKGFVYLLRAIRQVGPEHVHLELVGGTGDRGSRRLLARERSGLSVEVKPGDPLPSYHRAELFVLPSLEDGFGFVVAEAMACGLPVVVTNQCGASEWVQPGETGWVIPAADENALAAVLEEALAAREQLVRMGQAGRREVEVRSTCDSFRRAPCAS